MSSPRLSISLCTYNGARFLPQQLASLAAQTFKPDEMVVCDDHSSDESVEIARKFGKTAPFEVRVHVQPRNLGWAGNRQDSYSRCRGEFIAVCDQDDVWDSQKLEVMMRALEGDQKIEMTADDSRGGAGRLRERAPTLTLPSSSLSLRAEGRSTRGGDTLMAFCDSRVVSESLQDLGYTTFQITAFDKSRQRLVQEGRGLEALMANIPVADATMVFRASLLNAALPIPGEWLPDAWMAIVAAATGGCAIVPRALQSYRQHGRNLSGGQRMGFIQRYRRMRQAGEYFLEQERRFSILRERLVSLGSGVVREKSLELIDRRIRFAAARRTMRERPLARPFLVMRELARGNYHRMGTGLRTLAMDLVI